MKRILLFVTTLFFVGMAVAAVNINTATKEELEALNGIGPVKAQAIIDYRKQNGAFKSAEDIMKVRGIKEGEFGKIKGDISVSGATSMPAGAMKAEPPKAAAKAESAKAAVPAMGASSAPAMGASSAPAKATGSAPTAAAAPAMAPSPTKSAEAMKSDAKADKAMAADKAKAAKAAKDDSKVAKDDAKAAKDEKAKR